MIKRILLGTLALGLFHGAAADPAADALFERSFPDLQGKPTAMASLRGQPLVVNFWATWCQPCREEMPELESASRRHAGKVRFIGIALEEDGEAVRKFARQYKISYPVILAATDVIGPMRALGNGKGALPFTVVIDKSGQVADRHLGKLSAARLAEMIRRVQDK